MQERKFGQASGASTDLVAIGPKVICIGSLLKVSAFEWLIQVSSFFAGDIQALVAFNEGFGASPAEDHYVLVNELGDGRVLSAAPEVTILEGVYAILCPVLPASNRIPAQGLGSQIRLDAEGDWQFGRRVSGLGTFPQIVQTCLSMLYGESKFAPSWGARFTEYFERFSDSPWLEHTLKLELIRLAAIPCRGSLPGRESTQLSSVNRVYGIAILNDQRNDRLPIRLELEVEGLGRWSQEAAILLLSKKKWTQRGAFAAQATCESNAAKLLSTMSAPTTFISYSWDSEPHKAWVKDLADRLRADGVNLHFDRDLPLGGRLPHFMEKIGPSDYVLFICTPNYKIKSDRRAGGVGYEGSLITGEMLALGNEHKFIPVLASGTWSTSLPGWAQGKLGADLSKSAKFDTGYQDILGTICKGRVVSAPSAAAVPAAPLPSAPVLPPAPASNPVSILNIILDEVTEPRNDGTPGSALYVVPFQLSTSPSNSWVEYFLAEWSFPKAFTSMHRPGTASIYGDRLELDGVTIEEVRDYHKKTLQLCVDEANKKEFGYRQRIAAEEIRFKNASEAHQKKVRDIGKNIQF